MAGKTPSKASHISYGPWPSSLNGKNRGMPLPLVHVSSLSPSYHTSRVEFRSRAKSERPKPYSTRLLFLFFHPPPKKLLEPTRLSSSCADPSPPSSCRMNVCSCFTSLRTSRTSLSHRLLFFLSIRSGRYSCCSSSIPYQSIKQFIIDQTI